MKKNLLLIAALGLSGILYAQTSGSRSISEDYYWINASLEQVNNHSARHTSAIALDDQVIDVDQKGNQLLYQDLTDCFFYAMPGQTLVPSLAFDGSWMHSYVYIDYDNDGEFFYEIYGDGVPTEDSELVAYNAYSNGETLPWQNSLGEQTVADPIVGEIPEFTLPEDLKPGIYRMRFKVDWDCLDPAGNDAESNKIYNNGGVIADVMLMVYTDDVTVIDAIEGATLDVTSAPAGKALTITLDGTLEGNLTIKSGYNLDGDVEDEYGNTQYRTMTLAATDDNTYTIPADMVYGNVSISGKVTGASAIKALESVNADGETVIYNLNGQKVNGIAAPGIYIVNGKKTVLK